MTQLPKAADIAQIGQALLLGTRKRPVTLPGAPPSERGTAPELIALIIAGQHARFERPVPPSLAAATEEDLAVHADPRPMLSDASRRLLKQILTATRGANPDVAIAGAVQRVTAHGLRPHPFDLPWLAPHLKGADDLPRDASEADVITLDGPESWKELRRDQRMPALQRLRRAEPEAGRAFIELIFKTQAPADRASLLDVLSIHLTPADAPFLEKATQDRAEQVRRHATALLARLPGTEAYKERLGHLRALLVLQKPKKGAPAKFAVEGGKGPAGAVRHNPRQVYDAVQGFPIAALADTFGLTRQAFLDAVPDGEDMLILGLLATAAREGDSQAAAALARRLSGHAALSTLLMLEPGGLAMPDDCRAALTEPFAELITASTYARPNAVHALWRHIGGPLPEALAARLIASKSWRDHVDRLASDVADAQRLNGIMETALLMPDAMLDGFLASLGERLPHLTLPFQIFADFRKSLAQTTPVAPLTQAR